MKKILAMTVAILMIAALCVGMTGCAGKEGTNSTPVSADNSSKTVSDSSKGNDSSEDQSSNSALVAYAESQNEIFKAADSDAMTIRSVARGNKLAFVYKYNIDMDKTAMQAALDGLDSTYSSLLSVVQLTAPECEAIIVEFLDKSDKVVASKEYK